MDDSETYLSGLIKEIDAVKNIGGKGVLRNNAKISKLTADLIQKRIPELYQCRVIVRPCARCKNAWTIIVQF